MIKLETTPIEGLQIFTGFRFEDERGELFKVFNNEIPLNPKQVFTTTSHKDVIRGMHYQLGKKIICLLQGKALDVIVDIRPESKTYGKYYSTVLEGNQKALLLSEGLAHGFKSLTDNTIMLYLQNDTYDAKKDLGFHYNSFGFNWECTAPILSERDKALLPFGK